MRILLLIPSMAGSGGTERMVHSLSTLLKDAGHLVYQASFDPPSTQRHYKSSAPFFSLGPTPRLPLSLRPWTYLVSALRLRRLKKKLQIDLTISNLWRSDLVSQLSCGRDKKLALCHINVVGNPSNHLMLRMRPLVAGIYRCFDKVVAVSAPLARELQYLYCLQSGKISYINNFVYPANPNPCLPADQIKRFVWCGRMVIEKNVDGLLHAWAQFCRNRADVQLLLLGDGPLRTELGTLTSTLGLEVSTSTHDRNAKVVFAGQVSDPANYMSQANALLLTSTSEGIPMVILEALSLGIPVLASDCQPGGVRSALLGSGECNPDSASAELTPCGALLPVPRAGSPQSLELWRQWLQRAADDNHQWTTWTQGAHHRYERFAPPRASEQWTQMLNSLF